MRIKISAVLQMVEEGTGHSLVSCNNCCETSVLVLTSDKSTIIIIGAYLEFLFLRQQQWL